LSGSRLTVAFNQVRKDCTFISRIGMNMNEDSAIRSKNLLLQNAEKNKIFLFIEKCPFNKSGRSILSVDYMNEIITWSSAKKMMVPGIQELKSVGVGDAMLDTVEQMLLMAEDKVGMPPGLGNMKTTCARPVKQCHQDQTTK
jgi:hypothetical protein